MSEGTPTVPGAENVKPPPGVAPGHYEEPRESQDPAHKDAGQEQVERDRERREQEQREQEQTREREQENPRR